MLFLAVLQKEIRCAWSIYSVNCKKILSLLRLKFKLQENATKNKSSKNETTKNVPLLFLEDKVLTEMLQLGFWILSTNKQGGLYVFRL